jgi:hypothetical protein
MQTLHTQTAEDLINYMQLGPEPAAHSLNAIRQWIRESELGLLHMTQEVQALLEKTLVEAEGKWSLGLIESPSGTRE